MKHAAETLALAAALLLAGPALAQTYPSRPIEMIVPIAPGGGMDVQARLLAELVEPELRQKIVAVNRPGAGGTIGVGLVSKAAPDGYTIGAVWSGPLTASPHNQPVPYGLEDYVPVIQFSKAPFVVCAPPDFPAASGAELVAHLKQHPDRYTYGNEGAGGTLHLGAERIFGALAVSVRAVPFSGAADTLRNFLGGHVTLYAGGITSILPHMKSGKAKCLLLTSATRNAVFPQAAGLDDLGVGSAETVFWRAIIAPRGTPPEIVQRLEAAYRTAIQGKRFQDMLAGLGEVSSTLSGAALALFVREEHAALGRLARQVGAARQ